MLENLEIYFFLVYNNLDADFQKRQKGKTGKTSQNLDIKRSNGGNLSMKKKMTTVAFNGTQEQKEALDKVIEQYKGIDGAIMSALHEAQHIYGYLPIEVQQVLADGFGVSLAEVYGIVTFYSQFVLNPKGEVAIAVCMGTACYVKGAGAILDRVSGIIGVKSGDTSPDGKYSLEGTRCIGACGLAPVLTINEDVYGRIAAPEDMDAILEKYKV